MSYQEIVSLIFTIISTLLCIPMLHFFVFGGVGLFSYKKFPKAQKYRKYAVIISARNEEKVIANLVESVRKNNYPQDLLNVFVVAHNCTDGTAESSRNAGAVVYEYNNPNECTKGYALKYLFGCIEKDYGTATFDGFFIMDADNIMASNYIEKMNDAFEFYGEKDIITSFRNSKNFGKNLISGMYGINFASLGLFEGRGRTLTGCSAIVHGTGFLFSSKLVQNGWNYVALSEDWEFSADQIADGVKIRHCEDAEFFDEQPTSLKIMLRQRLRWARGSLMVFFKKGRKLFRSLFRRGTKNRGSVYDMIANLLPYAPLYLLFGILQFVLLSPLFGVPFFDGSFVDYLGKNWPFWALSIGGSYLIFMLQALFVFAIEGKRIKNVSLGKKIALVILYPFYNYLAPILQVIAIFANVKWKTIPHKEAVTHDDVNGVREAEHNCEQQEGGNLTTDTDVSSTEATDAASTEVGAALAATETDVGSVAADSDVAQATTDTNNVIETADADTTQQG